MLETNTDEAVENESYVILKNKNTIIAINVL